MIREFSFTMRLADLIHMVEQVWMVECVLQTETLGSSPVAERLAWSQI